MNRQKQQRARSLAFGIGTISVMVELIVLVALSHANAPEGCVFAGHNDSELVIAAPLSPVILLRRMELSL